MGSQERALGLMENPVWADKGQRIGVFSAWTGSEKANGVGMLGQAACPPKKKLVQAEPVSPLFGQFAFLRRYFRHMLSYLGSSKPSGSLAF